MDDDMEERRTHKSNWLMALLDAFNVLLALPWSGFMILVMMAPYTALDKLTIWLIESSRRFYEPKLRTFL